MIRHVSSTPSCRVKRVLSPTIAAWSSTSYGVAPSPPISANSTSNWIGAARRGVGAARVEHDADARRGIELDHELVGLRPSVERGEAEPRRVLEDEPDLRLRDRAAACRRG